MLTAGAALAPGSSATRQARTCHLSLAGYRTAGVVGRGAGIKVLHPDKWWLCWFLAGKDLSRVF